MVSCGGARILTNHKEPLQNRPNFGRAGPRVSTYRTRYTGGLRSGMFELNLDTQELRTAGTLVKLLLTCAMLRH